MKSFNFISSVIVTILLLIGGAALAAKIKGEEEAILAPEKTKPHSEQPMPIVSDYVSIEVTGVRSSNGKVLVMVFDSSSAFNRYDHTKAAGYQEVDAKNETLVFNFSSLSSGPYAVFVMHDENNDYQLNQLQGYPIEGFAVSGARNKYDEPSFKQAAVVKGNHKLKLVYF